MRFLPVRLTTVLLSLALVAAACGGGDGDDDDAGPVDSTSSLASTTTLPSVTLPPADRPIEPLTGRDLADESLLDRAAYATKIDNDDDARPQNGLNQADVVFELPIENNTSRLLAVFHSDIPAEVGPVRSARLSDLNVLAALGSPVFAYAGTNDGVRAAVRAAADDGTLARVDIDSLGAPTSFRDDGRPRPHNLIGVTAEAIAAATGESGAPEPIFAYRGSDEVGEPGEGGGVEVSFGSNSEATYLWGGATDAWGRWSNTTPHLDHELVQVSPENLVVLEVEYGVSSADARVPLAITVGTGPAVVGRNGELIEGTWTRGTPADPFQLTDSSGELIRLDPGRTWVAVVRDGRYNVLNRQEAVLRAIAFEAVAAEEN